MQPLTEDQVRNYPLPQYLETTVSSEESQKGDFAILNPPQWRELAVAAHRHIKRRDKCKFNQYDEEGGIISSGCDVASNLFPTYGYDGVEGVLNYLLRVGKSNGHPIGFRKDPILRISPRTSALVRVMTTKNQVN